MENKFVDGLFSNKREKSPDFVILSQSAKVSELTKWLEANQNDKGYVNWDVLRSDKGTIYAKLNDWKPEEKFVRTPEGRVNVEERLEEIQEEQDSLEISSIPF